MKNVVFGLAAVVLVVTAVGVYSADEQNGRSRIDGMMEGMMAEQKSGEQSHDRMQGMKEMMASMV